jgi:undecaprenyl-diphosphatase
MKRLGFSCGVYDFLLGCLKKEIYMTDTLILSLIQALTEFLPVSSTAHLIVLPHVFHIPTMGRLTEVALHMGTLAVVMVYFRKDLQEGFSGLRSLMKGTLTKGLHKWLQIACATLPVVVIGYGVHKFFGKGLRSFEIMGWSSLFFGFLLLLVDKRSPTQKRVDAMTYGDAFIIGLLQVIALIPGASRLGTTLITARLLGYDRVSAARFSFLLSIPVVIGATTLMLLETSSKELQSMAGPLGIGALASFALGYLVLMGFMAWLKRFTLLPFALYRIFFGIYVLMNA